MTDAADAAKARLAAVQAKFAGKLCDRIDELAAVLADAERDATALPKAIELAHRLAGTAGSFGYGAAGEEAGALEAKLIALRDGADDRSWPETIAQLQRVVAAKPVA